MEHEGPFFNPICVVRHVSETAAEIWPHCNCPFGFYRVRSPMLQKRHLFQVSGNDPFLIQKPTILDTTNRSGRISMASYQLHLEDRFIHSLHDTC